MAYPLPELLESPEEIVPFVAGWRDPVIVLPASWRKWDEFKIGSVLAHELAHVRRNDWRTALLASLNRAIFWYHPVAWWLERQLRRVAEEACDAAAIRSMHDTHRYAAVVLEFAVSVQPGLESPATAMARSSKVGGRIDRILDERAVWKTVASRGERLRILLVLFPLLYAATALAQDPVDVAEWSGNSKPTVRVDNEPPELLELRRQGNTFYRSGQYLRAIQIYESGYQEAMRRGSPPSALKFLMNSGSTHYAMFHYRDATQAYLQARELAIAQGDQVMLGLLCVNLSSLYYQMGDLEAARESAEQGLKLLGPGSAQLKAKAQLIIHYAKIRREQKDSGAAVALPLSSPASQSSNAPGVVSPPPPPPPASSLPSRILRRFSEWL